MNTKKKIIAAVIVFLFAGKIWANVIRVPQDYPTIQSAIKAAVAGDTVLVSPGIYHENIDFVGKDIVLGSLFLTTGDKEYLQTTVIDPDSGSAVIFVNYETRNALLCGFTITGGTGTVIDSIRRDLVGGAGILIRGASPVISSVRPKSGITYRIQAFYSEQNFVFKRGGNLEQSPSPFVS